VLALHGKATSAVRKCPIPKSNILVVRQ
jgi:hypothetical protein